jgi:hypothetical protein
VAIRLVQNTSTHNGRKKIHNYFRNVPCKKRWHSLTNYNSILFVVIKDNNILELQSLSEHDAFASKPIKTFNHVMLIYTTKKQLLNKRRKK